ncbi:MAG: type II toxin-antitoxin system toxin ribonuclease VapC11 [Acidobacteriota bacterium]
MKAAAVTLIDTSSWIEALRRNGDEETRERVRMLLVNGSAAWCDMIRLELWHGAGGPAEAEMIRRLEEDLPSLPLTDGVWQTACELGRRARAAGLTVPSTDLVIFACAQHHGATLEHRDRHFDLIAGVAGESELRG